MIGGSNFRESQFNLAVQGERQAGSSFKPFVLAAALNNGIAPQTTLISKPTTIPLGDKLWSVSNYEDEYLGPINLEQATIHSDNSVYAQLTALVGPKNVRRMAQRLGIKSRLDDYFAIGLGAEAVNPLEMARAFSTFANRGRRIDGSIFGNRPRAIVSVAKGGERAKPNKVVEVPALEEEKAKLVNQILQKVVTSGTGTKAALPDGRPVAGKTGTTENYGDAWFVGYTPQLAVAVWVGYPNNLVPMLTQYKGDPVAGGTFPALIWKSFTEQALDYMKAEPEYFDSPSLPYSQPISVVQRGGRLMIDNGLCRAARNLYVFSGDTHLKTAGCKPNEVEVPRVVGSTLAEARDRLALQPLEYDVVYKPARKGQRLDVVLGQLPRKGTLSAYDKVILIMAKPRHGVVPTRSWGMPVERERRSGDSSGLKLRRPHAGGGSINGRVVARSSPRAGSRSPRAGPGMPTFRLDRHRRAAEKPRARQAVAPRLLDGLRDPDPRADRELRLLRAREQLERRTVER